MTRVLPNLSIVIQAGGESKRMGTNKAVVPFLGEPLIMRSINRVGFLTNDLIITTNEPDKLGILAECYGRDDIKLIRDVLDKRGALNGIYTALLNAQHDYVGLVACDMIFPSAPLFRSEYELAVKGGYDVVIPQVHCGWEPFHAVYRRETCLKLVEEAISQGEIKASAWYPKSYLYALSRDEVLEIDPRGGTFVNANTPQELAAVEEQILSGKMSFLHDWPTKEQK